MFTKLELPSEFELPSAHGDAKDPAASYAHPSSGPCKVVFNGVCFEFGRW